MDTITSLDIQSLLAGYRDGAFTVTQVMEDVLSRIESAADKKVWITRLSRAQVMAYVDALQEASPETHPLYGIPFAIKDNIDLAGVPTTAACPDYAYTPDESAHVVAQLIKAGAIPLGKTNLDQFATGLVGVRSPYGACENSFNPDYISGGSSSGSAVSVATGLVSFSLGTDTAGSGRVPAAFNNLVGLKPTRGVLSTRGVVPACRSLDVVSIFALNGLDAESVFKVAADYDTADAYARPMQTPLLGYGLSYGIPGEGFRFGVPREDQLEFFDDAESHALFTATIGRLEAMGGEAIEIDFAPFLEAARLLYEGPWVSERYVAIEDLITTRPEALLEVTRTIIGGGAKPSAVQAFKSQYRLMELKRQSEAVWQEVGFILTPTAGTIYRIDEVETDPIQLNSNLGYYTNFMNLLDLSALAVPAGFRDDGLPNGVTLFAPAFYDRELLGVGAQLHRQLGGNMGATGVALPDATPAPGSKTGYLPVAVCGAHLEGLPLNYQLTERGGRLLSRTTTSANYRLFLLPGGPPQRPGLVRDREGGGIEVEVWELPAVNLGDFLNQIPAPLGLGRVQLADGSNVPGFLCEAYAVEHAQELTAYGSWRKFMTSWD
jgi:allophanate hydrolase